MPVNSEEKIMILKMLEEGKINSEEAARLLEALDKGAADAQAGADNFKANNNQSGFQEEVSKVKDRINEWKREFKTNTNGGKDFDRTVEDFAVKMEKVGKNVATTTFGLVDKMIDFVGSFIDTNSFSMFGNYTVVEKVFEAYPAENTDIYVEGINGYVIIKKHLENKVIIKSKVKSPVNNADSILMFSEDENGVNLKLNKINSLSVSHEVFLPAVRFKNLKIETTNGRIYVEDSLSENFEAITKNSHIELMGINSDRVSVSTKNAKIQISYVIGKTLDINTNNSVIDVKHIKTENLNAVTMNGRILVENVQNYENSPDINMYLKTSNGGIKVNMNDMDNKGYKVKAQTTNGGVNILIPEMTYHNINRKGVGGNFVEAESNNFNTIADKVTINAETVNGYIEIVK